MGGDHWSVPPGHAAESGHAARTDDPYVLAPDGDRIEVAWNDQLRPGPRFRPLQERTVSSWGPAVQADLTRLHIGIIGAGSVGALVAEALARLGIEWITLLDVVVKVREDDGRAVTCSTAQTRFVERGFPCALPPPTGRVSDMLTRPGRATAVIGRL